MLIDWANLNLVERCVEILNMFNVDITGQTLGNYYRRYGLSYRKCHQRLYSRMMIEKPLEYLMSQKEIVCTICNGMQSDADIIFFDETTINNWAENPKVWMNIMDPIVRMMPQVRMSITILGGINYRTGELFYVIDQKTNT